MTTETPQPVIFVGPSLALHEAHRMLEADFRPPIRRGDLELLLEQPPSIIGIIDGVFLQSLSVSPKEILPLLRKGVCIYGGSSLGALRAVELERYGMRGIGEIFRMYRSGRVDGDDEIAMLYSPDGQQALSEALVNIRCTLQQARRQGVLSLREADVLRRMAKALYFPDRTYERLLVEARGHIDDATLFKFREYLAGGGACDLKRLDAIALLTTIRETREASGQLGDARRRKDG
jgi:hypothetical protein